MSKEKIEEMAECCPYFWNGACTVDAANPSDCDLMCEMFGFMASLVSAGYRKQKEGENIGTLHPADEFVCSECGITLEGWTRVVTDEDDGELYYYEYGFRYCPNCGAKMRKEDEGK